MFATCVAAVRASLCQNVEFHKISKLNHRESELARQQWNQVYDPVSYATYHVTPPQLSFIKQPLSSYQIISIQQRPSPQKSHQITHYVINRV